MHQNITKYVNLEDIKIAYREYGTGKPLILLHGNSQSKVIFEQHQVRHFQDFHTYAIDSRGHGESISNDTYYAIEQYCDDVIRFCESLKMKEAYVMGYSDGANIALYLAKKRPDIFVKLLLVSPNYLANATKSVELKLTKGTYHLLRLLQRIGFSVKNTMMRFELMIKDIGIKEEELSNIKTNVRIIYAEKDMFYEEHFQQIHDLIPQSSLQCIANSTHKSVINSKEMLEDAKNFFA
ncbi:alpha/beta hydrolase [Vallitalea pronyensis]|uniref:Alpha/beta hydrolase n=1 Tax=Vallitalea pronyensis TaxID=1348613 RepID=A0A8J8MP11_9FIRM|nr:alpha/beta fold hydrolase [Vallitalea pronyensis]QUI25275.1 alpha/beta hydrolase [Vallitalea pronyensis]